MYFARHRLSTYGGIGGFETRHLALHFCSFRGKPKHPFPPGLPTHPGAEKLDSWEEVQQLP